MMVSLPKRGSISGRQLVFDLAHQPSFDIDEFLVSTANETAFAAIERWPAWPDRVLLLIGPAGSGKSHLAAIWAAHAGASIARAPAMLDADTSPGGNGAFVLEDCDQQCPAEADLFHLLNGVREAGGWLLMTARAPPDTWGLATPDLLSRLRLAPSVVIGNPDAALLSAVLVKLFADRQIAIDEEVVAYAARHCDQSLEAVSQFVVAVDDDALASGRRITRQLAAQTIARLDKEKPALE